MDPVLIGLLAIGAAATLAARIYLPKPPDPMRDAALHLELLLQRHNIRGRHRGTWIDVTREEARDRLTVVAGRDDRLGTFPLRTGDLELDELVTIEADDPIRASLLDRAMRDRLRGSLSRGRLVLSASGVRVEPAPGMLDAQQIVDHVDLAVDLAQTPATVERLLGLAERDPEAGVRRAAVALAGERFGASPGVADALERATRDPSPEVRLAAALALGPEGQDVLRDLLRADIAPPVRASALEALAGAPDAGELVVAVLVPETPSQLLRAAIRMVATLHLEAARDRLEPLSEGEGLDAVAAAEALITLGDLDAEPRLLGLLAIGARDVQVAAVEALGRAGSPAAIEPLSLEGELADLAARAIAAIRSRIPEDAERGTLSLATLRPEAGALSTTTSGGELDLDD